MKRPMLVSGIAAIVTCTALITFKSGIIIVPILAVSVLILYSIKKLGLRKLIIIPTICICAIIFTTSFLCFNKTNIEPIEPYDNITAHVFGRVNDTPVFRYGYTTFNIKADKIDYAKNNLKIEISIYGDHTDKIKLFDYIALYDTQLSIPKNSDNSYNLSFVADGVILDGNVSNYEILRQCNKTPYYYTLYFRELVCNKIDAFTDTNQGGLLKGILFGDTNDINSETNKAFKASGISHLLAVSGMHTSLYCGIIIALLSSLRVNEKIRNCICLIFLFFFSIISGLAPSVLRAAIMMAVVLLAPIFKREADSINSLGISVVVLLLFNPYILLNAGFQLSVSATLGVLLCGYYNDKIQKSTEDIPINQVKKLINGTASSFLVSIFAAVFTMPVCAYHFGSFSLLSIFTNILTIELSFAATVLGIVSIALGFIEVPVIKDFAILAFKVTSFFIDLIIEIAKFISGFKFCTVPIHKNFLIPAIIIGLTILFVGCFLYILKKSKFALKVCAFICFIPIIIFSIIPIVSPNYNTQITVLESGANIQIVLRSGTKYAYLENTADKLSKNISQYMPGSTCEELVYYLPTYLGNNAIRNPDKLYYNYTPSHIAMPQSLYSFLNSRSAFIPKNTVIKNSGIFNITDEIAIEIVDTYHIKYAIIRGNKKTVYVHLHGDTNFSKYVDTSVCDIAVYNGEIPTVVPNNVTDVILCGEFFPNEFKTKNPQYNGNIYMTAQTGDISIYI